MAYTYDRYHHYDEICMQLTQWVRDYPSLASLSAIGVTIEGRTIYALEITDSQYGEASSKPACLVTGNLHSAELAGSEAAMYTAQRALEGFETNEHLSAFLRHMTLYVIPSINCDGREYYLNTPYHEIRGSIQDYFPEEPGVYANDINNDGLILKMRIEDPSGDWVPSKKDPRALVKRGMNDAEVERAYRLYPEGLVRGDKLLAPGIAIPRKGLDPNRSFPFDWDPNVPGMFGARSCSGPEPLSEPETRALADFVLAHKNIVCGNDLHTHGAGHIAPTEFCPEHPAPWQDISSFHDISQAGAAKTGYSWCNIFPQGARGIARGSFTTWLYFDFGISSWCTELWSTKLLTDNAIPTEYTTWTMSEAQVNDHQVDLLRWADTQAKPHFYNWTPYTHPQLGQLELGGWDEKYIKWNPPTEYLEAECRKAFEFTSTIISAMPRLTVSALEAREDKCGYRIDAVITNSGFLSTSGSYHAREMREDINLTLQLFLNGDDTAFDTQVIEHLDGYERKQFSWILPYDALESVDVCISSLFAGSDHKKLCLSSF